MTHTACLLSPSSVCTFTGTTSVNPPSCPMTLSTVLQLHFTGNRAAQSLAQGHRAKEPKCWNQALSSRLTQALYCQLELTLKQCGLTLHGSHLHADVFINKYTGKSFGDTQQSLKNLILFSSLRRQYVIHMTYKMCVDQLCYWLPVNSRPLVEVLESKIISRFFIAWVGQHR